MSAPKGAVERVFGQLLVGAVKSTRDHDERNAEMGFDEVRQQFQSPLAGVAGSVVSFYTVHVDFDYPFHYAPGQRDNELNEPQLSFSGSFDSNIGLSAIVRSWDNDPDNGAYIGATVAIGVTAMSDLDFSGLVHLTFEGWGALAEVDPT